MRDIVFAGAVYVFFTSFTYLYYLYHHFGVPVQLLEIPFNQSLVYAYTVITRSYSSLLLLLPPVFVAVVAHLCDKAMVRYAAYSIAAVALLPILRGLAFEAAADVALDMRKGLFVKTITFVFAEEFKKGCLASIELPGSQAQPVQQPRSECVDLLIANDNLALRLIAVTKDHYYVLRQPHDETPEVPFGFAYEISKGVVTLSVVHLPNVKETQP